MAKSGTSSKRYVIKRRGTSLAEWHNTFKSLDKERRVLLRHYLVEGRSLEWIADKRNISREVALEQIILALRDSFNGQCEGDGFVSFTPSNRERHTKT